MTTTLTREQFLQAAPVRFQKVDVPGMGTVLLRSISATQKSRRFAQRYDQNAKARPDQLALQDIYAIIDHVMIDEQTPMFTDQDIDIVGGMDAIALDPLYEAINEFNAAERELEKNVRSGSPTTNDA